jgi:hypothetical protein
MVLQSGLTVTGPTSLTGTLTENGNATISGTLGVSGATTLAGLAVNNNLAVAGNETVGGTLGVTGATTLAGVNATGEVAGADFKTAGLAGATTPSRYVGSTARGAPTSGTFAAGDFVVDATGQVFTCLAGGTPGTWSVPVGANLGRAIGNGPDSINNTVTVASLAVALVAGCSYMVHARHQTVAITATLQWVNGQLNDSAHLLPTQSLVFWSANNVTVNQDAGGGAATTLFPAANTSTTITMVCTSASSGGGGARTPGLAAELNVVRIS